MSLKDALDAARQLHGGQPFQIWRIALLTVGDCMLLRPARLLEPRNQLVEENEKKPLQRLLDILI